LFPAYGLASVMGSSCCNLLIVITFNRARIK
jgi:hypothetical protein